MWKNISPDKCASFIESHFGPKSKDISGISQTPAITITRATGAGAHAVVSSLIDYLKINISSHDVWTVFSQHLVAKVLEENKLQDNVGDFMKEDRTGTLKDGLEELLGLHPSSWTLIQKTNATILRLAQKGNVILVGRGANIVTRKLQNVFHVRLVGSLEKRIERVQEVHSFDRKAALQYIKKQDEGRKRYLSDNFDKDIDDPLLYHVILNTDLVPYEEAARLIGHEVIKHFRLDSPSKTMGSMSSLTQQ